MPICLAALAAVWGAAAAEPQVSPGAVSASVTEDWNQDGGFDRAVLVERDDSVDLYVYLSEPDGMALAHRLPDFAWRGGMWGQQPSLAVNSAGSLQVISGNQAIGRSRWQETVTIAWREGRLVVAGFTFSSDDTLEPGLTKDCDANFLSGRGLLDGESFAVPSRAVPLEDWSGRHVPPECAAG